MPYNNNNNQKITNFIIFLIYINLFKNRMDITSIDDV